MLPCPQYPQDAFNLQAQFSYIDISARMVNGYSLSCGALCNFGLTDYL